MFGPSGKILTNTHLTPQRNTKIGSILSTETKIRVYKVAPAGGFSPCSFSDVDRAVQEVKLLLTEGEVGDAVAVETTELTQEDYDSLPEHPGY